MYARNNPYIAHLQERALLTGAGSTKSTYHLVLKMDSQALPFSVGDSIGVLPTNDPEMVDEVIKALRAEAEDAIQDARSGQTFSLRDFLLHKANLHKIAMSKLFPNVEPAPLIDLIAQHRPEPSFLCQHLLPLMPRFYSIASSPKVFPDEIHLTVAQASYTIHGKTYLGVGSSFLCSLATPHVTPIPIYIQPASHFSLPQDPHTPIILIGPGTGIAPFRAFLQERMATQAPGKNWLFFGERNRASDFYYSDFWLSLQKQGKLRLSLAFSRDTQEKVYVQHRMLEERKDLWQWMQEGAYVYVCGDAARMAKDVDSVLQQIAQSEGGFTSDDARTYLKNMRQEKRYLLDVY